MAQVFTEEEVKKILRDLVIHAKQDNKSMELLNNREYRELLFDDLINITNYHEKKESTIHNNGDIHYT